MSVPCGAPPLRAMFPARARAAARTAPAMSAAPSAVTPAEVGRHYDEIDPFYRALWGEHLHHGLWRTGRETVEEATAALVDLVAEGARVGPGARVCDVGCGYGGTARALARERGAEVVGLTVSAAQHREATARAAGVPGVTVLLRDWLANGLPDAAFDAVVAVESTEHMADKPRVFAEMRRVLRPGGRLVVCAWLAADGVGGWRRRHLLDAIVREGVLASLDTEGDYLGWMRDAGLRPDPPVDLSRQVARTWAVCTARMLRRLATHRDGWAYLRDPRATNRAFALAVPRLWLAYRAGAMRYVLFCATCPGERPSPVA